MGSCYATIVTYPHLPTTMDFSEHKVLEKIRFKPDRDAWRSKQLHAEFISQLFLEMERRHLTQEKLAKMMGISQGRLSRLLTKNSLPVMERLAYALDVSLYLQIIRTSVLVKKVTSPERYVPVEDYILSFTQEYGREAVMEPGSREEEIAAARWEKEKKEKKERNRGKSKKIQDRFGGREF